MDEQRKRYLLEARDKVSEAIISSDSILKLCNYLASQNELTDLDILEIKWVLSSFSEGVSDLSDLC